MPCYAAPANLPVQSLRKPPYYKKGWYKLAVVVVVVDLLLLGSDREPMNMPRTKAFRLGRQNPPMTVTQELDLLLLHLAVARPEPLPRRCTVHVDGAATSRVGARSGYAIASMIEPCLR